MTETTITATETVRNGVDTTTMFATLDAIKAQPEIAEFRFRARNRWLGGAHNRSTIKDFYAACDEDTTRTEAFTLDAGSPRSCSAPTPVRTPPSTCCTRSPRA